MTSKEIIKQIIVKLEDDLQHYTMVDIDRVKAKYIELEIKDYKQVLQDLERLEALEKKNQELETDKKILRAMYNDVRDTASFYMNENEHLKEMLNVANYVGCGAEEKVWDLMQENEKLKKIKTNIENKIKFIESCIVKQELNGNEVAVFNLKWQIDLLKEVLSE